MPAIERYNIAMCNAPVRPAFNADGTLCNKKLQANIAQCCARIKHAAECYNAKVVVFPEFTFTGYQQMDYEGWLKASVTMPGPETEAFAEVAAATGTYVVIQAAETHPDIPGRYFLSSALLTPSGEVGMVYRKNYAISLRTSPNDVFTQYTRVFGESGFFPVYACELGNIGMLIGAEPHWPEAVRSLALNGAELIVNSVASLTGVDYMQREGAASVRGVRAFENQLYFAMANVQGEQAAASACFDYNGKNIAVEAAGDDDLVIAEIDITALREARKKPATNFLAQLQPAIHSPVQQYPLWPSDVFAQAPAADAVALLKVEQDAWQRFLSAEDKHPLVREN
ncbi:hypothetical protein J3369_00440 [Alteromonas sp. NFXS44]|uniref:carbon-nitrogen hydrolase family protein n=1 Tax=Alteromonas sp. NFXS44 TaxID=2818435 RepID=UPI0032DF21B9